MAMNRIRVDKIRSSKRARCALFFLAGGLGIGAWASSLPLLSGTMGLDKGQLGILLLCFAAGAIVLMVRMGGTIDRMGGSHFFSLGGCVIFGCAIFMIPLVQGLLPLGLLVFIAGAGFGTLDVSMNTEASEIERARGRHLMSSFHALFSIGNILGAFLVGKVVAYGGNLQWCLGGGGALVILTALSTWFFARSATSQGLHADTATNAKLDARLNVSQKALVLVLGVIAFLALLAEGGMMDWTAIYMVDTLGASESVGAYAFAVFAAAMAIGRLIGDYATKRIGHVNLLRIGGGICAVALMTMLITKGVVTSLVVLGICGLGVANMVPAVFASAGNIGAHAAGRAMSIVTTMGYSGLLLGPALLGFVAQASSLTVSLALIMLAFALISAGTFYLNRRLKDHHEKYRPGKCLA